MAFNTDVSEGFQGRTRFFTGAMTWGELDQMAVFPDELSQELEDEGEDEERMQRGLSTKRIPDLVAYLTDEEDHFFSALTLIILPRDLNLAAQEVEAEGDGEDGDFLFHRAPNSTFGRQTRGTLHLSGGVRLFPADGQHRLKAGMIAMREKRSLAKEQVPVVLVPYTGPDQVRQLFSDLNLNAKPVNKTIGLDFDRRTPVVQVAKAVAGGVELFRGRVNRISNSLSKTSTNVITMNALVEGTRSLLYGLTGESDANAQNRLLTRNGNTLATQVIAHWEVIVKAFEGEWDRVLDGEEQYAAGNLRQEFVFPHGLGWQALTEAAGELMQTHGDEWAQKFQDAVHAIDWSRNNPEWQGVAMVEDRVNNTGPGIRATVQYILSRTSGVEADR